MGAVPNIDLNDGKTIPQLGFGVFQIDPGETAEAVTEALRVGYRHIDTAEMYGNEREVGEGIRASGLDRGDVFITSKLNNSYHEPDDARRAFDETLSELGFDYVDLFLIHWPLPTLYDGDFVSTWKTLEEFKGDGRARSIGVSNFQVEHLERLAADTDTVPAVNQIEVHPYFTNDAVRAYGQEHGIATEAWSPIAQGGVLEDSTITRIADDVGKTPAQVVLRWHIQRGDIVFPKSVTPSRIQENFEIFDFELGSTDMEEISDLGFDYVDLFLIHWPLPTLYDGDYVSTWRTLEEFKEDGRASSIGVSNFQVDNLERLAAETDVVPAVNQIELHPYLLNEEVRSYGESHGIATEAWSPIAQGAVLDDPTIAEIAERLGRTPAQVVLRWHIQRGSIVFPKSTTPERIRENFELFDFDLEPGDVERIEGLDRGEDGRTGPHPDRFAYAG